MNCIEDLKEYLTEEQLRSLMEQEGIYVQR